MSCERTVVANMFFSGLLLVSLIACGETKKPVTTSAQEERPLEPKRLWLLEQAFNVASAFPLDPHVKTRSRVQEMVVKAALDLGQSRRALEYAHQIQDWRKGLAWAEYSRYQAKQGNKDDALHWLMRAGEVAEGAGRSSTAQEWRRDRIRAAIAAVYLQLGMSGEADKWSEGLVDSESRRVALARAEASGLKESEEQILWASRLIESGNFEQVWGALSILTVQFVRNLEDSAMRARIDELMEILAKKMPLAVQVEMYLNLTKALVHKDCKDVVIELLTKVDAILREESLLPEDRIQWRARIGYVRAEVGEKEHAKKDIEAALEEYEKHREALVDIYRARTLRPIAEAFQVLGETEKAASTYKLVLEEGNTNPNSRPRAEDLVATCISMAIQDHKLDQGLSKRIEEIAGGLHDPW